MEFESDQRVKIVRILAFEVEGWRWLEGLRPYQRSTRNERRSDLVFPGVFCITSGVWTSSFNRYHSISFTSPSIKSFLKYLAVTYAVCPTSQFRFICGRVEAGKPACGAANKRILIIINPMLLFETSCFGM